MNAVEAHKWSSQAQALGHARAKYLLDELDLFHSEEIEKAKREASKTAPK